MNQFTINVPIRSIDAEDVKNAFADAYGYRETIDLGNGVAYPNPVTKEVFVKECCTSFLLSILKGYMVENAEAIARQTATSEAVLRAAENTALFDQARIDALPVNPFTDHPSVNNQTLDCVLEDGEIVITLTGTDPSNLPLTFEIVDNFVNGSSSFLVDVVSFTPTNTGQHVLTFKATNGTKYSPQGTITVNVTTASPTSTPQIVTIPVNSTAAIVLTGEDPNNLPLTHSIVDSTQHGDLTIDNNSCTYTPFADFIGTDSFSFTSSNGTYTSDVATVTIEVIGE